MSEQNLKKSYRLFIVFLLLFLLGAIGMGIIVNKLTISSHLEVLIWLNICNVFLCLLFYIIYKTERIYYINFVTYKEANAASSHARRDFAYKHLSVFIKFSILFIFYSLVSYVIELNLVIDVLVYTIAIIFAAVKTIPIKLEG